MISVLVGERIGRNQVAPPDFRGIDAELMGGEIEQPLDHEHAVLAAGAAIGRHDRQIGEDGGEGRVIGRHHVGTEQGALAVDRHREPVRIIGAAIVQEDVLDAEDAAVARKRNLGVMDLAALLGGGEKMLEPVLDPFDRAIQPHRDPGQRDLFRIEHHDFRPEAAADKGRDDAHLPFAEAEDAGQAVADEHRRLRRVPDRHVLAARVPLRHHAARLDRGRNAVLIAETALQDQMRLSGRAAVVALGLVDLRGDIGAEIVVHQRRAGAKRRFEIDHRRQRLEIDLDIVERVFGNVAALGNDDGERLADVADLVPGERHLGALVEDRARNRRWWHQQGTMLPIGAVIIGRVDRDHAGTLFRARDVDALDPPMRDLAAQEGGVQHAGQFNVVDEQRLAGEKFPVLVALDRGAEKARRHGAAPAITFAAASIASTMFW